MHSIFRVIKNTGTTIKMELKKKQGFFLDFFWGGDATQFCGYVFSSFCLDTHIVSLRGDLAVASYHTKILHKKFKKNLPYMHSLLYVVQYVLIKRTK